MKPTLIWCRKGGVGSCPNESILGIRDEEEIGELVFENAHFRVCDARASPPGGSCFVMVGTDRSLEGPFPDGPETTPASFRAFVTPLNDR
jgi:hypothetical protein